MDPVCPKYPIFGFPTSACLPCDPFSGDGVFPLRAEPLRLSCHRHRPLDPHRSSLPSPANVAWCPDPHACPQLPSSSGSSPPNSSLCVHLPRCPRFAPASCLWRQLPRPPEHRGQPCTPASTPPVSSPPPCPVSSLSHQLSLGPRGTGLGFTGNDPRPSEPQAWKGRTQRRTGPWWPSGALLAPLEFDTFHCWRPYAVSS